MSEDEGVGVGLAGTNPGVKVGEKEGVLEGAGVPDGKVEGRTGCNASMRIWHISTVTLHILIFSLVAHQKDTPFAHSLAVLNCVGLGEEGGDCELE